MKRRPVIAANWKMQGNRMMMKAWCDTFITQPIRYENVDIVVCPPFPYLPELKSILPQIKVGAQDVSNEPQGAFTGQVSAAMLKECGCEYVIVGHSERRAYLHESNALVAQKVLQAFEQELTPILCVGETLAERQQEKTEQVVSQQLGAVLEKLTPEQIATLVVAYEPVWAIGTGLAATAAQAQTVHAFLRQEVQRKYATQSEVIRIIYGGSVKPDNAAELLAMPDIDGALVGGASLDAQSFAQIVTPLMG